MSIPEFSEATFSGRVRLFPLPDLVMFPHVVRPLHIFEPRYQQLLQHTLADDQLIGMAMLAPGWEALYEGRPPLHSAACLCGISAFHRFEDGTYNLLIHGLRRIKLVHELPPSAMYREAEVALVEDSHKLLFKGEADLLRIKLVTLFQQVILPIQIQKISPQTGEPEVGGASAFNDLLQKDLPLGALTDVLAYALDLPLYIKQLLLSLANVGGRAKLLIDYLATLSPAQPARNFPPEFSIN